MKTQRNILIAKKVLQVQKEFLESRVEYIGFAVFPVCLGFFFFKVQGRL